MMEQIYQRMYRIITDHTLIKSVIRICSHVTPPRTITMQVRVNRRASMPSPFYMSIHPQWIPQIPFSSKSPTIWIITTIGS